RACAPPPPPARAPGPPPRARRGGRPSRTRAALPPSLGERMFGCKTEEKAARPSGLRLFRGGVALLLDGALERAARRELGHAGGRNVHLLGRIPRVHALARGALRRRELAEAGERHRVAGLE